MKCLKKIGRTSIFLLMCLSLVLLLACCTRVMESNEVEIESGEIDSEIEEIVDIDRNIEGEEDLLYRENQQSYFYLKSDELLMERYEEVLNTCVTIQCGGYRGEGSILFLEEDIMYVVSVKHLLGNDSTTEITFYDGITLQGEVVYLSQQYDFGFVRIEGNTGSNTGSNTESVTESWSQYGVVKLPDQNQLTYSHYIVVATLNGRRRQETLVGTVLDPDKFFPEFNSFLIHHYCLVEPGMSGSGVFNENGEYQGILVGGLEQESVSLSYEYVQEEFELFMWE